MIIKLSITFFVVGILTWAMCSNTLSSMILSLSSYDIHITYIKWEDKQCISFKYGGTVMLWDGTESILPLSSSSCPLLGQHLILKLLATFFLKWNFSILMGAASSRTTQNPSTRQEVLENENNVNHMLWCSHSPNLPNWQSVGEYGRPVVFDSALHHHNKNTNCVKHGAMPTI